MYLEISKEVFDLLFTIVILEKDLEDLRCLLAENEKFCTWEAFSAIDRFGHGYITP